MARSDSDIGRVVTKVSPRLLEVAQVLIRFEVENFRSILGPVELSMVAVDEERAEARAQPQIGVSLVSVAGVFGPNASGKSNVLAALIWLRTAIATSLRQWDEEIPIEPFAFGDAKKRDTSFALELAIDGIRFEYLLDVGRHIVSYEALFHYPEGRRRRVFERENNELTLQRGLGKLAGTRALLTDRSLALSIMRRFDEPLTSEFARQVTRITSMGVPLNGILRPPMSSFGVQSTLSLFDMERAQELQLILEEGDEYMPEWMTTRDRALALLKLADLGVADVEIEEEAVEPVRGGSRSRARSVQLIHQARDEKLAFNFHDESAGTRTWFRLIGPVLTTLQRGGIVLFDELDSSLHPTLTSQLVRLFSSPGANPRGAQLVFTTHDTNLLNQLNRDEVWLTQKLDTGATRFGALSDFAGERVRRSSNIESGYLSGRFGALPDISHPEILRELGLIG